jgi:hypothetical protein
MPSKNTLLEEATAVLQAQTQRGRVHYVDLAASLALRDPDRFGPTEARKTPHFTLWRTLSESAEFEKVGGGWFAYRPWGPAGTTGVVELSPVGASKFKEQVAIVGSPVGNSQKILEAVLSDPERRASEISLRKEALADARARLNRRPLDESSLVALLEAWRRCGGKEAGSVTLTRFGPAFSTPYLNRYREHLDVFEAWVQALEGAAGTPDLPQVLDDLWRRADLPSAGTILPSMILHTLAPERFFPWTDALARGLQAAGLGSGRADGSGAGFLEFCEGVRAVLEREGVDPMLADALLAREAGRQDVDTGGKTKGPSAPRFTREGFALLEALAATEGAGATWFADHAETYKRGVREPLLELVHHVGRELITPVVNTRGVLPGGDRVVVEPKAVMARINGQAPRPNGTMYYPYLWAAFHPASHGRRQTAVQLFVTVHAEGIDVGLALDAGPAAARDRFRTNLRGASSQRLERALRADGAPTLRLRRFTLDQGPESAFQPVSSATEMLVLADGDEVSLAARLSIDEALAEDVAERVERIARALLPWMVAALVDDLGPALDALGLDTADRPAGDDEEDEIPGERAPTFDLEWLQAETLLPRAWLDEVARAATFEKGRRGAVGQVVLYGPPGTGKTWLAEKIALHLVGGDASRIELVQLHPAYGYEHFMEGYRPRTAGENLVFSLEKGIVPRLADRIARSGKRHVLIVDEMNRGDLPQILGELLYLLARRGDESASVALARSGEPFSLPAKLVIIGTMNTADRSIAHVDFALRRRFRFFAVAPSPEVVTAYVARHSGQAWGERLGTFLLQMNERIARHGKGLQIGHSYLLDVADERALQEVWESEIFPTLEDWLDFEEAALRAFSWDSVVRCLRECGPTEGAASGDDP